MKAVKSQLGFLYRSPHRHFRQETLSQAVHTITTAAYQSTQDSQQGTDPGPGPQETGSSGPQPTSDDDVVDAEYREVA